MPVYHTLLRASKTTYRTVSLTLSCDCSHFDVNFAKTGLLDTDTCIVVVGHSVTLCSGLLELNLSIRY